MSDTAPVTKEYLEVLQLVCKDYRAAPKPDFSKEDHSAHVRFGFYACPGLERLIAHANRECVWENMIGNRWDVQCVGGQYFLATPEPSKFCSACGGKVKVVR